MSQLAMELTRAMGCSDIDDATLLCAGVLLGTVLGLEHPREAAAFALAVEHRDNSPHTIDVASVWADAISALTDTINSTPPTS